MFGWIKKWFASPSIVEIRLPVPPIQLREETKMLINLIEGDPDWEKSRHDWYHPAGLNLWVGNKEFMFSVKWNSKGLHDYDCDGWVVSKRDNPVEFDAVLGAFNNHHKKIVDEHICLVAERIIERNRKAAAALTYNPEEPARLVLVSKTTLEG